MEAGLRMGFGTDLMGEMIAAQSKEFALRANVLDPMSIIQSATSVNAEILGQSGRLGCISSGAMADMIIVDGDPTEDISLLEESRDGIRLIMKDGRIYKNQLN